MNEYFPPTLLGPRPAQYRIRLTAGGHSARHIRRIARSCLEEWELAEAADAVELALTELLANVVRHVPDRRCVVVLLRLAAGVRGEVTDGHPQLPAARTGLRPEAESGRGLVLLDAVVDKWGVDPEPGGGKTVWFECSAP
ncbi:ATP-binding protein [Streptomyces sp. 142MFCol3.1]|uniref:ATP-binding protein n=1 Tax=Streptomyces sp. 142MFCol3.1 TaxID=1172179 RepID=UPI0004133506|nr:ATP-binding protein [Streptomyces sp. 142MFCol3.1]